MSMLILPQVHHRHTGCTTTRQEVIGILTRSCHKPVKFLMDGLDSQLVGLTIKDKPGTIRVGRYSLLIGWRFNRQMDTDWC